MGYILTYIGKLIMIEEEKMNLNDTGDSDGRSDMDDADKRRNQRPRYRKKILDTRNLDLDFKKPETLERFISRTGKILPRRMTGASARVQRLIAREIKRAREVSLLPFTKR
jgi:small subunit ribosomal protein S18